MAWTTSDRAMTLRERSHAFDLFAETMDGWRLHLAGRNASVLAFFSFLSIFPLMLAAVTILGFVLEGNEDLQRRIVDSAASEIPVLGDSLAQDPDAISGSWLALVIGLGGALWSSTKAFVGLQSALDDSWDVPVDDRDGLPVQRGKALLGLAIIATSLIGSLVIAGIVNASGFPVISNVALVGATVAINVVVIAAMYRLLTSHSATLSDVWPGALIAGVVFTALQHFGTAIVKNLAGNADATQGTINSILALLTWLSLIGITVIMCAEFNAARARLRRGPHLSGDHLDIAIRT